MKKKPGYYWMLIDPLAQWQIVQVSDKKVGFCGIGQRMTHEEFRAEHPAAVWSGPIKRPAPRTETERQHLRETLEARIQELKAKAQEKADAANRERGNMPPMDKYPFLAGILMAELETLWMQ